jgi:hypothetical protein
MEPQICNRHTPAEAAADCSQEPQFLITEIINMTVAGAAACLLIN